MPNPPKPRDSRPDSSSTHHVPAEAAGATVAAFLRHCLAPLSWAAAGKLAQSRKVMIDGNICTDQARRLKGGEVIKVLETAAPAPPKPEDVEIVYLDDALTVVDKPSGLTTTRHHEELSWPARRRQLQPTLDEMLPGVIARTLARSGRRSGQAARQQQPRVGPVKAVHRIDRETSGLLVFARTVPAGRILAEQFRLHATHRRYIAICVGRITARTIRTQLIRDRGDGRRGSTESDSGKEAITHVQPLEHFGNDFTLVECRLETGRTHQIRIHLSEQGNPVCGERVYTSPRGRRIPDHSRARRVMLHAAELGFVHPVSGEEMRFNSPMPDDFKRLLARLRETTHRK
jgi:23S rRNA pseudouridine1911/1915/1917 synthase